MLVHVEKDAADCVSFIQAGAPKPSRSLCVPPGGVADKLQQYVTLQLFDLKIEIQLYFETKRLLAAKEL